MDNPTFSKYFFGYFLPYVVIAFGVYLSFTTDIIKDRSDEPFPKKPYSFSRAQLMWWSVIIISIFCSYYGFHKCFIEFDQQHHHESLLILLGISISTTGIATFIDYMDIMKDLDRHQDYQSNGFFTDILSDKVIDDPNLPTQSYTENKIASLSVHRFQALCFNVIFGLIFIFDYIFTDAIFEFNTLALALMGISAGGYLLLKQGENIQAGGAKTNKNQQNLRNQQASFNIRTNGEPPKNLINQNDVVDEVIKKLKHFTGIVDIEKNDLNNPNDLILYYTDENTKKTIESLNLKNKGISLTYKTTNLYIKPQFKVTNNANKLSTIGGILKDNHHFKYGLGTGHGLLKNSSFSINPDDNPIYFNGDLIGVAYKGDDKTDSVVVLLNQQNLFDNSSLGNPTIIPYTLNDIKNDIGNNKNLKIRMKSNFQKDQLEGLIYKYEEFGYVDDLSGNISLIKDLIAVQFNNNFTTQSGDSGAWAISNENKVVGMLIGIGVDKNDKALSYFVSMEKILASFPNFSIYINN